MYGKDWAMVLIEREIYFPRAVFGRDRVWRREENKP
jgi:hypothetical protein